MCFPEHHKPPRALWCSLADGKHDDRKAEDEPCGTGNGGRPQMSKSRIDRHRARQLEGSARDRARQYFSWFTLFATGSKLLLLTKTATSMKVLSDCAWLCWSSQQARCMPDRSLGQIRDGLRKCSARYVTLLPRVCTNLTEISFGATFLTPQIGSVFSGTGATDVFISRRSRQTAYVDWVHRRFNCHDDGLSGSEATQAAAARGARRQRKN